MREEPGTARVVAEGSSKARKAPMIMLPANNRNDTSRSQNSMGFFQEADRPLLPAGFKIRGEFRGIRDVFFNLQEIRHEVNDTKREQDSRDAQQDQNESAAMPFPT